MERNIENRSPSIRLDAQTKVEFDAVCKEYCRLKAIPQVTQQWIMRDMVRMMAYQMKQNGLAGINDAEEWYCSQKNKADA